MQGKQHGGTIVGFIVGVLVGLGAALAVAVYVTKVPVPFVNKGTSARDTQQPQPDWNPNAALQGRKPASAPDAAASAPQAGASGTATRASAPASTPASSPAPSPTAGASRPSDKASAARSADPLGDLAASRAAGASGPVEPVTYFVQTGAWRTLEEAESQRAKLALQGIDARITEREQSGRTVWRVRAGPLDRKDDAERLREKLEAAGFDAVLVRVQR